MKSTLDFQPKLFSILKNYSKEKFSADLMAGIIVGIVALPLAIAFGIASGVSPEKGLITAIIGGFIVSFLGGSNVQIGGPTGAFIVIVYSIIQNYGLEGLAIATVMAGLILVLMGCFRLGTIIKYIPYPIVIGFTSGIALTIFTTQIKDLFGLTMAEVPADFISKWIAYFRSFNTVNWSSLIVGIVSILLIILTPKISKKIPGSLVAIIIMTIVTYILKETFNITGIETIGDRFSNISNDVPEPQPLSINMNTINQLLSPAFTIAILGAIESLLSATVADGVTGDQHNSNTELIGQGVANIVVPFFGGIPVTGAIARTMTNINNGGRTPIAGIIHAIVLLLIFLFLMPLIKLVPMACLAGVLIIVSYNMSGWRTVRSLLKTPKSDVAVLLTTFILTVVFNLTIAIEIGLLLAVLLFLRRVSENVQVSVLKDELDIAQGTESTQHETLDIAKGIEVYEIDGPFFFGVATKFDELMHNMGDKPLVRIIRMRKVPFIDSTGLHNLEILVESSHREKIHVILSGVNPKVHETIKRARLNSIIGDEYIFDHITKAVTAANKLAEELSHEKKLKGKAL
ncbi:SulP family inorganic anion transporter [Coprobacter secundus]|jgi:sulfate permease|uniref:SulP family inorganic anion transporter n=1 Tax=Coprobacter secundus TaxID=1501392 RepID=UPI000574E43F|nr:sulfate permease [Coprobacter secundus]KHM45545.1 sulfate permease [Coprobacter secundus]